MTQPCLWIADRSARRRVALARLAAAPQNAVVGAPGEARFETAPEPDVVVLGLDDDWERELQFAFATGRRATGAHWILVGSERDEARALASFDTRRVEFLPYPPAADLLRSRIRAARSPASPPSLSERQRRARIAERFTRWFEDLELPDVLRALDPRLSDVPVLIRGERGTGRAVIARYLHLFSDGGRGAFAHLLCDGATHPAGLASALADSGAAAPGAGGLTLWLENAERLSLGTQRTLLDWLEAGPPSSAARWGRVRWIASVDEAGAEALDPALRLALGGISIHLPPLRERTHAIGRIAAETARAWCAARQERPRRLGEDALAALEEYPWPGNLRELEALVVQSLANSSSDPMRADDLQLDGSAFSPLDAAEFGEWIGDEAGNPSPHAPEPSLQPTAGGSPVRREIVEVPLEESEDDDDGPSEAEIEALLEASVPEATPTGDPADRDGHRPERPPGQRSDGSMLSALAQAVSSEVRNPLLTLRTFADLLPERFDDESFRERFAEALRDDVGRMDALVERLGQVAHLSEPVREKVDLAALLESLLEERRQHIRSQRLLVLKELDTQEPHVLCDPRQLRFALDTLLGKALEWVPTHGDVYLASRHHPGRASGEGGPSVRVLIRFHDPDGGSTPVEGGGLVENSFELIVCEIVIRAQGGTLSVSSTDGEETVIVIDLPA